MDCRTVRPSPPALISLFDLDQKHYRRIREKALADAQSGVEQKTKRNKYLLLFLCFAIFGAAIFGLVKWVMPDPDRFAEPETVAESTLEIGLSTNDMEALLFAFLEAESVEEQLKFVDHPEISEPRMRKFYEEGHAELPLGGQLIFIQPTEYEGEEEMCAMIRLFGGVSVIPFLKGEDGKPKLEWESVVGWMDPSWEEILEAKPEEPVEVKVFALHDDYYNYAYRDEEKWFCVRLSDRDFSEHCYAYFERGDPRFAKLEDQKPNVAAPLTLELKFGAGRKSSQAEITDYRTLGWAAD